MNSLLPLRFFLFALFSACLALPAAEIPIAPLDGNSLSSTFETDTIENLPLLGWTAVSGTARVFDVANGALISQTPYGNYQVQYVTSTAVLPNTQYRLRVEMGFVAAITGGSATYLLELGTVNGGDFSPLGNKMGTVNYAGNIAFGTASGTAQLDITTEASVSGDPLAVRWRQTGTAGSSDNFGIDNVVLSVVTSGPRDLDSTFGTQGKATASFEAGSAAANGVAVQSDGKIVVVGTSGESLALARLTSGGVLDESFGTGGRVTTSIGPFTFGYSVAIQGDGKIVVGGASYDANFKADFTLVRYTASGVLDTSFGAGGVVITPLSSENDACTCVMPRSDGKIIAAGHARIGGNYEFALVRYNADGSLDGSFGSGGKVTTNAGSNNLVYSAAIQSDGKIVLAGTSNGIFALARYQADGSLDTTFNGTGTVTTAIGGFGDDEAYGVGIQSDGKIVAAGYAWTGSTTAFALARYHANGSLDTSFNGTGKVTTLLGGSSIARGVALQSDGKIVVAGYSATGSVRDFAVARYTAAGTLDTGFGTGGKVLTDIGSDTFDTGYSVALQSNGKIVVAGASSGSMAVARYEGVLSNAPEIDVQQPSNSSIASGGSRGFGNVNLNSTIELTFTIANTGTADLALTGTPDRVAVTGTDAGQFTVTAQPASPVTPGSGTTFTVRFAPTSAGAKSAVLTLANDDSDEATYTINLTGTGAAPEIDVQQPAAASIASGGSRAFGNIAVNSTTDLTFSIANAGTANLDLTGSPKVAVSGPSADQFAVTAQPSTTTVSASGNTVFTVRFAPTTSGIKNATLTIASNDSDEGTYTINISGIGLSGSETFLSPLDGSALSSTFETSTQEALPKLGWTSVSGSAQVFDLATNGALIGGTPYGNYQVQHATGISITPNTRYKVSLKMGFFTSNPNGAAGYVFQLGTLNGGIFTSLADKTGSVSQAGYFGSGVASGSAQLMLNTGSTVSGDMLAIRWAQTGTSGTGFADFFGIDDVMLSIVTEAAGDLDPLNASVTGDYVQVVAVQPDGKTIIAGNFTSVLGVTRNNIARLNADGTLDLGFDPRPNNEVNAIVVQPDGKVLMGGYFTTLQPNGAGAAIARQHIARLNADGTLDESFDPKADNYVYGLAVQADGKILLAGEFTTLQPNGAAVATTRQRIARLNADGTLDPGFDPQANAYVTCVALQADGKVLLAGAFTSLQPNGAAAPTPRQRLARLNADGTLDAAFDPNANSYVYAMAVQPDGKVLIGGFFTALQPNGAASATARQYIARLNADGTLDSGFDPKANNYVYSLAVQADGKVLAGGLFTSLQPNGAVSSTSRQYIARLNADGTLDPNFDPKANNHVIVVAQQADGKVLVGGLFSTLQPNGAPAATQRQRFARLLNDPATQLLTVPNASQALWTRGGTAPDLSSATFELSVDGGATWGPLAAGTRVGATANWQAATLALPASGHIRARGRVNSGANGSYGLIEQIVAFSIPIPEMNVTGNGINIVNGDSTPDTADHTDFGAVETTPSSVVRTFVIANTGQGILSLTGTPRVAVTGAHAADFTVTTPPAASINALGGTASFQVAFSPQAPGLRSATLSIANSDQDENPYTFSVQGTGLISSNANLNALELSAGSYSPAFAAATTSYTLQVASNISTTTVTATGANVGAVLQLRVNGGSFSNFTSGSVSSAIPLNIGANAIDLRVTAQDGTTQKTYTVSIIRAAPGAFAVPELMYYRFDGTGTNVPNQASAPVGAASATLGGALAQGGTGQFGGGLIGSGNGSTTDFLDTGWATNLSGSWTISLYLNNIQPTGSTSYFFGDLSAGSFRCFTGGVAGTNNLILRGPFTDVLVANAALTTPTVTTFVYDAAAAEIRAYLNGVLVNTVAQSGPITISGTGPFKVAGYSTNFGPPPGGVVDEFRLYNRALSAAEITETWNAALPVAPPTALENFRAQYFGSAANSGNGADLFDFDNDGLTNLVEFAFGLDPTQAASSQLPQAQLSGGNLSYAFTPPAGATGITYAAEWSTTLLPGSWTSITNTGTPPQHLFSQPIGSSSRMFLRFRIISP